jgi:hypothetical protein
MPLPIINSIASWILKKRIHQIELFIKISYGSARRIAYLVY